MYYKNLYTKKLIIKKNTELTTLLKKWAKLALQNNLCFFGWMDGGIDGWMDGWMNQWIDDGWMDVRMDG